MSALSFSFLHTSLLTIDCCVFDTVFPILCLVVQWSLEETAGRQRPILQELFASLSTAEASLSALRTTSSSSSSSLSYVSALQAGNGSLRAEMLLLLILHVSGIALHVVLFLFFVGQ